MRRSFVCHSALIAICLAILTPRASAQNTKPAAGDSAKPAFVCNQKPDSKLPTADAVVDTALVQSLMAGSGPAPKGFAQMALRFDKGALVNIAVLPTSDLPDPVQRQLATLVASNLKPHDKKTPSTFILRVDSKDDGLHYAVEPPCSK